MNTTKTCPACAEQIQAAATVCRYCGHTPSAHIEVASGAMSIILRIVVWGGMALCLLAGAMSCGVRDALTR